MVMFHITQQELNHASRLHSTAQKEESPSWKCWIIVWTKCVDHPLKRRISKGCSCAAMSTSIRPCMDVTWTHSSDVLLTLSSWNPISLQDSYCGHSKIYSGEFSLREYELLNQVQEILGFTGRDKLLYISLI